MTRPRPVRFASSGLPPSLRTLFWDHDFARLTWESDRDLIVGRVLASGDWDAVQWLRRQLGTPALRDWLTRRRGAGLSPRQLRFWQVILGLPRDVVDAWLADLGRQPWQRRRHA
jgi:hypothetical protein